MSIPLLRLIVSAAGSLFHAVFLLPVLRTVRGLPPGRTRKYWRIFLVVIFLLIAVFALSVALLPEQWIRAYGVLLPVGIFLLTSFLLLLNAFSLQSMRVAELEKEIIIDPLTGLYSKRFLKRRLEEEIARSKRYTQPLAALLIDVDGLKDINANYGQPAGNGVLAGLGEILRRNVRETDTAARLSGDEILVLSPNTNEDGAAILAERVRSRIEASTFGSGEGLRTTVSVGVAVLGESVTDSRELLDSADTAMYTARERGENRVVVFTPDIKEIRVGYRREHESEGDR